MIVFRPVQYDKEINVFRKGINMLIKRKIEKEKRKRKETGNNNDLSLISKHSLCNITYIFVARYKYYDYLLIW